MPRLAEQVPGRLIRAAYIFVVVGWGAESKSFASSFRFLCLQTFLLFMMGWGDHLSMLDVKMTVDIPKGTKFYENLLFPMRELVLKSLINSYTFRSIPFHTTSIIFVVESQKA